ncbi:MAG TPA: hypothetical protein VM143_01550 [Acidimicrobiales bacterium]|nr:hypothetical protein [Acidimicrobiales bacterium]
MTADDRIDEALEQLHATSDEYQGGLTNHGPMVVEALSRMGRADEVPGWVRAYARSLEPFEGPAVPPVEGDWREAVREELTSLVVGSAGAAGHGVIRTAHAAALLEEADTPVRRQELARALAYWRRNVEVVEAGPALVGASTGRAALLGLSGRERPPGGRPGFISDHLRSLGPIPTCPGAGIDEIVSTAATVLAGTRASATIPLVHAVTTPAALAVLEPYLPPGVAAAQAWLVAAALVSAYGDVTVAAHAEGDEDSETAVGLAVESRDEHAIKLAATGVRPAIVAEVARRLR